MEFLSSIDEVKKTTINDINIDIHYHIIDYLDYDNLLVVSAVYSSWNDIINRNTGNSVWRKFSDKVYDGKYNRPLPSLSLLDRIKSLSMADLKKQLRRVDTSQCLEKKEYQHMMMAHVLFTLRGTTPPNGHFTRSRCYYPQWSIRMDEFKATYYHAHKDFRRVSLFMSELCQIKWSFHFKNHDFGDSDENESWISEFKDDYTMTSQLHQQEMRWQFIDTPNGTHIQVEQYPPLRPSRMHDGSWRMENMFVFFLQTRPMESETLPLF